MAIIIRKSTPNTNSRYGHRIQGLIFHSTWGFTQGTIAWFANKNSGASAHYLVDEYGKIYQFASDSVATWHAGVFDKIPNWMKPNPNYSTIGIELTDKRQRNWNYPKPQWDAFIWLTKTLVKKYNLPKQNLYMHKQTNPSRRTDPVGSFSLPRVLSEVYAKPKPVPKPKPKPKPKTIFDKVVKNNVKVKLLTDTPLVVLPSKKLIKVLPKGTVVDVYGTYDGKWKISQWSFTNKKPNFFIAIVAVPPPPKLTTSTTSSTSSSSTSSSSTTTLPPKIPGKEVSNLEAVRKFLTSIIYRVTSRKFLVTVGTIIGVDATSADSVVGNEIVAIFKFLIAAVYIISEALIDAEKEKAK